MDPLFRVTNVHMDDIHALVQKENGEILSGSKDCTAKVWGYSSEKGIEPKYCTMRPNGNYQKWVTAIHPFPDGSWAVGFRDGTLQIHGLNNRILVKNTVPRGVEAILKERNARRILFIEELPENGVFMVGLPKMIGRCSLQRNAIQFEEAVIASANDWPYLARPFGEEGHLVAVGSDLELWKDLQKEKTFIKEDRRERVKKQRPHISSLEKMASPSEIALGTFCQGAHVFDLEKQAYVFRSKEHLGRVWSVLPLEEKSFASAGDSGLVKIWDIRQKRCVKTIEDHDGRVSGLLQVADKAVLAASCPDDPFCSTRKATFTVWDLRNC